MPYTIGDMSTPCDPTALSDTTPENSDSTLYFLRAAGRRLTKLHTPAGSESAELCHTTTRYQVVRARPESLLELQAILERVPSDCCLINACPREANAEFVIGRKGYPANEDGSLVAYDCRWIAIDFELAGSACSGLREISLRAQECLSAPFRRRAHLVQASASTGLPGKGHRARLWFLCDAPVSQSDLKLALRHCAGVDLSLYSVPQCNYVAAPLFDGVEDPFAGLSRFEIVGGIDLVSRDTIKLMARSARASRPVEQPVPESELSALAAALTAEDHAETWVWLRSQLQARIAARRKGEHRYALLRSLGLVAGSAQWRLGTYDALQAACDAVEEWFAAGGGGEWRLRDALATVRRAFAEAEPTHPDLARARARARDDLMQRGAA